MATTTQADPVDQLYKATATPQLVHVPALHFLSVDGVGDPNTSAAFADAVQALYSITYGAKFALKRTVGATPKVSPLETLWWAEDMSVFTAARKDEWHWTAMIRQPDVLTHELISSVVIAAEEKNPRPVLRELELRTFDEGAAAQLLHVGTYATEAPTIERLHAFIHDQGFVFDGRVHKHHEIYLSDPRRSAPEKLRTIIRQSYAVA